MTILAKRPPTVSKAEIEALVRDVLTDQRYPERTEVSIHLVSTDEIRLRNRQAFDKDEPTDVVSFPIEATRPGSVPHLVDGGPPLLLGDVFIAPDVVNERALDVGFDPDAELMLMAVHGVLHLLGFDHIEDADANAMEAIEERILSARGYARR